MDVSSIVADVRDFLADTDGTRWSDSQLISLINRAQNDIAKTTYILRGTYRVNITNDSKILQLPDDFHKLVRVVYNDEDVLPIRSMTQMDKALGVWETDTGQEIECIVFDNLNKGQLRPYPIITNTATDILYQSSDDFGFWSDLGDDDYGIITDMSGIDGELLGYGTTIDIRAGSLILTIYYIKKPKNLYDMSNELDLDDIYLSTILHYVCGTALRNDKDTISRALGNEELALYSAELREIQRDSANDFLDADIMEIDYRRF